MKLGETLIIGKPESRCFRKSEICRFSIIDSGVIVVKCLVTKTRQTPDILGVRRLGKISFCSN